MPSAETAVRCTPAAFTTMDSMSRLYREYGHSSHTHAVCNGAVTCSSTDTSACRG